MSDFIPYHKRTDAELAALGWGFAARSAGGDARSVVSAKCATDTLVDWFREAVEAGDRIVDLRFIR
jgi:hypothetical protein